jgi:hypothetical protein
VLEVFNTKAGDISKVAIGTAGDLSKIVVRLYDQSDNESVRRRCLDAIDRMESGRFFGMSEELGRLDR